MKRYILKRLLSLIPVLFVVSVVVFSVIHLTPGDPVQMMLGDTATPEMIAEMREQMGLNDSIILQYIHWIGGLFQGDLGDSYFINEPMSQIIAEHIGPSFALTLYAMIIATVIAIVLGVLAAKKRGSAADNIIGTGSMIGISLPSFLTGLFLMLLFSVKLQWFPVAGYTKPADGFFECIRSLTLPAIALGLQQAAVMTRMTRSSVLEILNSDYIKMARSKGVKESTLVYKHALRNALLPIITLIGTGFTELMAGTTVVENVFGIPGMGLLVVNSVSRRDYEVVQITVLVVAVINVAVMLIVDLIYAKVDPRVKVS